MKGYTIIKRQSFHQILATLNDKNDWTAVEQPYSGETLLIRKIM
jgi:hypothetical protein